MKSAAPSKRLWKGQEACSFCREVYGGILPIWRACRTVDGIAEVDMLIYGTQSEAIARMRELNAESKKGEGDK